MVNECSCFIDVPLQWLKQTSTQIQYLFWLNAHIQSLPIPCQDLTQVGHESFSSAWNESPSPFHSLWIEKIRLIIEEFGELMLPWISVALSPSISSYGSDTEWYYVSRLVYYLRIWTINSCEENRCKDTYSISMQQFWWSLPLHKSI